MGVSYKNNFVSIAFFIDVNVEWMASMPVVAVVPDCSGTSVSCPLLTEEEEHSVFIKQASPYGQPPPLGHALRHFLASLVSLPQ